MLLTLGFFFFDMKYLLMVMIPGILITVLAQWRLKSAYARGSEIQAQCGLTGAQAAQRILEANGLDGVPIEETPGHLSDHYDPSSKVVRLSPEVYHGRSMSSLGVAAHEVGHAIQDATSYSPLVVRNMAVPLANFGSMAGELILIGGLLLRSVGIASVGVVVFSAVVGFQLLNLPCEFNASSRAREQLQLTGLISHDEDREVGSVLNAAALTYVGAAAAALLQLAYWVMHIMAMQSDDD